MRVKFGRGDGPAATELSPAHRLAWWTYVDAARLICQGRTFATASRIALVVGTVLTLVNQGAVMAAGDLSWPLIAQVVVNYLVPFTVSSMAYLVPFRMPARAPEPGRPREGRAAEFSSRRGG